MLEQQIQQMADKIDDLKNKSRRNNVRIVGLPESIKTAALFKLCAETIPAEVGLNRHCSVENAHRMGGLRMERKSGRQAIAKYLNYQDKTEILRLFRNKGELYIDGHKILLFADYSIELTKKRKQFSAICTALYQKQVKFTLAYPATLHVSLPNGDSRSFIDPQEAERFLDDMEQTEGEDNTAPQTQPQQQRTPIQNRTPRRIPTPRLDRFAYRTPKKPRSRYR